MKTLLFLLSSLLSVAGYSKTISSAGDSGAVQSAINSAASGDTVKIAAGHFVWSAGIEVNKFLKLAGDPNLGTVIEIKLSDASQTLLWINPSPEGSIEVSHLHFVRGGEGSYLACSDQSGKPVLVHDILFETTGFGHGCIRWFRNGGVIYNCTFTSTDKADNNGIQFKNGQSESAWHEASTMGSKDDGGTHNTYVEDCTFNDQFVNCMDVDDNSRSVIRHCIFNNSGMGSHGQETSPVGVRQWELYQNEFIFSGGGNCTPDPYPLNINWWFYIRGGAGVCWGNFMPGISSCAWGAKATIVIKIYNIRRPSSYVPCQTHYPAARQPGLGSDGSGRVISDPLYFWDNLGTIEEPSIQDIDDDGCGNNQHTRDYVVKGRDYFVGTPKPGYTPYTYPHPLRTGTEPGPSPSPTATPTPLPTPTPTPTPSPALETYRNWLDKLGHWIHQNPAKPDPNE